VNDPLIITPTIAALIRDGAKRCLARGRELLERAEELLRIAQKKGNE
jgi:hypothetical protein